MPLTILLIISVIVVMSHIAIWSCTSVRHKYSVAEWVTGQTPSQTLMWSGWRTWLFISHWVLLIHSICMKTKINYQTLQNFTLNMIIIGNRGTVVPNKQHLTSFSTIHDSFSLVYLLKALNRGQSVYTELRYLKSTTLDNVAVISVI